MNEDIRNFTGQQSQANQRNVDKDGIFLTENFGGLNTESSSMNMPLTDSAELMNVTVETSGKLRKRYGSVLLNEGSIGNVDQHIPISLVDGTLIHVLLGETSLTILEDALDTSTVLYSKSVFPSITGYKNTSYTTFVFEDFTYVYFAREGTPPILLQIYQQYATNTGTSLTVANYNGTYRDTSVVTNSKFKDASGVWQSFTSINSSTGASVLSATPASNGTGVYVMFNWRWLGETAWRLKEHLEDSMPRLHANRSDARLELSSRFVQHNFAMKSQSEADRNGQHNGTTRWGCSATPVQNVSTDSPAGTAPTQMLTNPVPQSDIFNCADRYWISGGQYVRTGAYSTVSGNSPSTSLTNLFLSGMTHLQLGGVVYTDAGYSVPNTPGSLYAFSHTYLPFYGGSGLNTTELAVWDNNVAAYTNWTGAYVFQTTGTYVALLYRQTDASGAYVDNVPNTSTDGTWAAFTVGSKFGMFGTAAIFQDCSKHGNTWFGSDAQEGKYLNASLGTSTKDGIWTCHWGLSRYMNYKTGNFSSVIGRFQDRLVLSGFVGNPGLIAFSNVGTADETNQGMLNCAKPNRNFDVVLSDPELATSPLEIQLSVDAGEYVTCVQQWYDDLFVGTNKKIYRIHGGDNLAITPSNVYVSKVANVGTIRNGMTLTEDGVFFVGEAGVYRIYLDVNTGSYRVNNVGLKIRPEIQKGMDRGRFANSVGRITYDNVRNVLYVLIGDEHGTMYPRRCFVYFADRDAWSEYSIYSGYMEAMSVSTSSGRVFMSLFTSGSTYTSLAEFEKEGYYTDLIKTVTLSDSTDNGYDLSVPAQSFLRTDYVSGQNVVLSVTDLKMLPITDYSGNISVSDGTNIGVLGTDFYRRKNNQLQIDGTSFWTGSETATVTSYQNESNPHVLNVYSPTDVGWLDTTDLDYTTAMQVQAKVDSGYNGASAVLSLSYPTWWMSPAFTRNDLQDYKRMKHFYGVFENSGVVVNNAYSAPTWEANHKFNVSIIQNGTLSGQSTNTEEFTVADLTNNSPAWLDYYRVSLPIKGNFVSFQAGIHSFNRGTWEMVGYQIDTDKEGRTSRRAYNE